MAATPPTCFIGRQLAAIIFLVVVQGLVRHKKQQAQIGKPATGNSLVQSKQINNKTKKLRH